MYTRTAVLTRTAVQLFTLAQCTEDVHKTPFYQQDKTAVNYTWKLGPDFEHLTDVKDISQD